MKKKTKLILVVAAVLVGVVIGVFMITEPRGDFIGEEEVRAMVTDRYRGDIENVSVSEDKRYYIVSVEDTEYNYEITINRDDSAVENIETEKVEKPEEENTDTAAETGQKEEEENDKEKKNEEEPAEILITEEEARAVAANEVGGIFIHSTFYENTHPKEYQVIQLVDDDDEGALVTIDARNGEATKVLWFEIEFEDINDIEAFAQELQDYNTQYQNNYYIEFDDYGDDDD